MFLRFLSLASFRNFPAFERTFNSQFTLVVGRNGTGKTSILEAISVLLQATSFRTKKLDYTIAEGSREAVVSGTLEHGLVSEHLVLELSRGNKKAKKITRDGVLLRSVVEYVQEHRVVAMSPEDYYVIRGEPQQRRSLLDSCAYLFFPEHLSALRDYGSALAAKRALLKQERIDRRLLDTYNHYLAVHGSRVVGLRQAFLVILLPAYKVICERLSHGSLQCKLLYRSTCWQDGEGDAEREARMESLLQSHIQAEIEERTPLFGPHRDDLGFYLADREMRKFASTGEIKLAVLAYKLTVLQLLALRKHPAVVLLDDLPSEFDTDRLQGIAEVLRGSQHQFFVTMTDLEGGIVDSFGEADILRL